MKSTRLPVDPEAAIQRRRGRVRETRATSGFPASRPGKAEFGGNEAGRGVPMLLDVPEVAHLLGLGRTKAYQLIAREEIPVIRIGRCVRVPLDELKAWIASRVVAPIEAPV